MGNGPGENAEEGIAKLQLRGEEYNSAAVFALQKKQRENMRYMVIGKVIAVVIGFSFLGFCAYVT